jgi:site-specific DNA-methyltransferase (adenine-specific)
MPHKSENARRLTVHTISLSNLRDLPTPQAGAAGVWLFILPLRRSVGWSAALGEFARGLDERSIVAVLASPADAAETAAALGKLLHFQLWVAVKLREPIAPEPGQLPQHHAALLIFSKYRSPLQHTKTRVGYSYCPACERTTKDYGGKKHTYHEYGTLLSDVWRDIAYAPGESPAEIIARLADLFGLEPHRDLTVVDLTKLPSVEPKRRQRAPKLKRASKLGIGSDLIRGDCLTELRKLPAGSVDFAFADPPYNLDKRYDAWDDAIEVDAYLRWCEEWLDELARVLRPGRTCAVLNIPLWAIRHFEQMSRGLEFQSWIAWEGLSLPVRMIMPAHYAIVCFSKGPPRPVNGVNLTALREDYCLRTSCMSRRRASGISDRRPITDLWWDIHRLKHNSRRVDHPCQLPPALMRRLIELFTREGEVVLDPFNGAGTSTLCAAALGRRYLGIELSRTYHQIARSRHDLLRGGGDPFEKAHRVPASKNSHVRRAGGTKYDVPKKTLQLDVKRVAALLGRLPSRREVQRHGRYPVRYYDDYFTSWGEVCAAARTTGMSERKRAAPPPPGHPPD